MSIESEGSLRDNPTFIGEMIEHTIQKHGSLEIEEVIKAC
jgi:hypothetical protein